MKLNEWLKELDYKLVSGNTEAEVSEVVYDSRKAAPGAVFVCMTGTRVDSHKFIPDVLKAGVRVLVTERDVTEELKQSGLSQEVLPAVTVLRVPDSRRALALLSAARFDYPARKLTTVGVTGTKGKTTTTHMVKAALEAAGEKVGMIGTIGIVIGDELTHTVNTTPESYELHQAFAKMVEAGCSYGVMEVSSQAVKMHRIDGIHYDYALFTNISPDHIGPNEHADFGEYLYYKSRLLNQCDVGLVNRDDSHFGDIVKDASCKLYTYSVHTNAAAQAAGESAELGAGGQAENGADGQKEPAADFVAENLHYVSEEGFVGTEFQVSGACRMKVRLGIPGLFNVYNALAAISLCSLLKTEPQAVCRALEHIRVNGRMEIIHAPKGCTVIVDYAHNALSMESLLSTLRDYHPKRLVCVFGCGGNRSKDRRYSMGEIGGKMADLCILTEDNSRYEKVEDIIADIRGSVEKTGGAYKEIPDRREAIRYSIMNAEPGDMIAVIGKGHEDYQEVAGVRHHFLDREVIDETIRELKREA